MSGEAAAHLHHLAVNVAQALGDVNEAERDQNRHLDEDDAKIAGLEPDRGENGPADRGEGVEHRLDALVTTAAIHGTPCARKARPPPIRSAAAIETSTRQVDARRFQRKSGDTNKASNCRATATGPGRMNSGRCRASAHQPISESTTTPSPISRSASTDGNAVRSGGIVARHPRLQRSQHKAVHAVNESDNDDDDGKNRCGIEFLARQVDHVAESGVAAK